MLYNLSEDRLLVQKTFRNMAQNEIAPRAKEIDKSCLFPWENLKALADTDLFGINIPSEYGGAEADKLSYVCPGYRRDS